METIIENVKGEIKLVHDTTNGEHITVTHPPSRGKDILFIYDSAGDLIVTCNLPHQQQHTSLNISKLPSGRFYLVYKKADNRFSLSFQKQ